MKPDNADCSFKFKFFFKGAAQGFLAQRGSADAQGLTLGKEHLPYDSIAATTVRNNKLLITLAGGKNISGQIAQYLIEGSFIVLTVFKVTPKGLKRHIDHACSKKEAKASRAHFTKEGKGHLFRSTSCPECRATIDLSELKKTQYVYCRFCETVFDAGGKAATSGAVLCGCDECEMFGRVKEYTEFYFYFLLVFYGFSSNRRNLCDGCANKLFWRTFLKNFIFILGIVPSIAVKIKSSSGRDRSLKDLAKANSLSLKGRYKEASPLYRNLYRRYYEHPGLLMNEGMGYLCGDNADEGLRLLERSLGACSNYLPTVQLLHQIQAAADTEQQAG